MGPTGLVQEFDLIALDKLILVLSDSWGFVVMNQSLDIRDFLRIAITMVVYVNNSQLAQKLTSWEMTEGILLDQREQDKGYGLIHGLLHYCPNHLSSFRLRLP